MEKWLQLSNLYIIICDNVKTSVTAGMAEANQQLAKGCAHLANWHRHLHPPKQQSGGPKMQPPALAGIQHISQPASGRTFRMRVLLRRSLVAGGNIFEGGNGALILSSLPFFSDHCEVTDLLTLLLLCWAAGPKEQSQLTMN